jgi:hypothetical protein
MKTLKLLAILFLLATLITACSDNPADGEEAEDPIPEYNVHFTHTPLALPDDLVQIAPQGTYAPPAHTMPRAHIGMEYIGTNLPRDEWNLRHVPVYAPAAGFVRQVFRGDDDQIFVGADPAIPHSDRANWYLIGHVLLRDDIEVGTELQAGELIGTTSLLATGIDFGVVDYSLELSFINPERYTERWRYAGHPLRYYDEPLKSQLLALVNREGPDKYGKSDYDIPGRLSGGWFHETLTEFEGSQMPEAWSRNLAFMYRAQFPDVKVLSSGGCEECPLPAFGFIAHRDDPDWGDVSVEIGPVLYRLYTGIFDWDEEDYIQPIFWARVQLISDEEIYLEAFETLEEAETGFTEKRVRYIR